MSGITAKTRKLVLKRAEGLCERCGEPLDSVYYSLQHRRARGMGGSRLVDTNNPINLIALCGTATTPNGCHHEVEDRPSWAITMGYRVMQGHDPATQPVYTRHGWVYLLPDGTYSQEYPEHAIPPTHGDAA